MMTLQSISKQLQIFRIKLAAQLVRAWFRLKWALCRIDGEEDHRMVKEAYLAEFAYEENASYYLIPVSERPFREKMKQITRNFPYRLDVDTEVEVGDVIHITYEWMDHIEEKDVGYVFQYHPEILNGPYRQQAELLWPQKKWMYLLEGMDNEGMMHFYMVTSEYLDEDADFALEQLKELGVTRFHIDYGRSKKIQYISYDPVDEEEKKRFTPYLKRFKIRALGDGMLVPN